MDKYFIVNAVDRYGCERKSVVNFKEMQRNSLKAASSLKLSQILNSNLCKNEENCG